MGCDIHCYGERRVNGAWEVFDGPLSSWSRYERKHEEEDDEGNVIATRRIPLPVYSGRNYALFTILAGVRDYGPRESKRIADPRGVPDDASADYLFIVESWGVDGHSHSWLTLRELAAWPWGEKFKRKGLVDAYYYAEWKARDFRDDPLSWCESASGKLVSRAVMEKHIEGKDRADLRGAMLDGPYVRMTWEVARASAAPDFVNETLHYLHRFVPEGGTLDDVRIVFLFDN
jgi:hypothetical protein